MKKIINSKLIQTSMMMPEPLIERLDNDAKTQYTSRTEIIKRILVKHYEQIDNSKGELNN